MIVTIAKPNNDNIKTIVDRCIYDIGNKCNLNFIDTESITDMGGLFSGKPSLTPNHPFIGDISEWDVSKVKTMHTMFYCSKFNGDISDWDVSSVEETNKMFARSSFNGNISRWNTSNFTDMRWMFFKSEFNQDISGWNVPKCYYYEDIFENSPLENKPSFQPQFYK